MPKIGCKYKHQTKAIKTHCLELEKVLKKIIRGEDPTQQDFLAASELLMAGERLREHSTPCFPKVVCARQDVIEQAIESFQDLKSLHLKKTGTAHKEISSFVQQEVFINLEAALKMLAP